MDNYKDKFSMEHLYAVLDSTHNGIVAINKSGIITLFNKGSEKILGINAEEALGKRVEDLLDSTALYKVIESGEPDVGRQVTINNRTIYTNRSPVFKNGDIIGAVAIFQDITDFEEMSKELVDIKNSVEILETILESTYDGIVVVDKNGIVTKFNKAYQQFLGIEEKDVLGKFVADAIENTRMHIVVKTGRAEIGEKQKIQGHEMVVMRIPIYKDGEVVGAVGKVLFRDVKEIKALADRVDITVRELKYYKGEVKRLKSSRYNFKSIVGDSSKIIEVKEVARQAASSNSNVLIRGESGTGKELFAHAIHDSSLRRYGAFIRVNCAAIPANLLESELFGYEAGAFTGAKKEGKPGKFEMAQGGTIFLDEIGDMPIEMQVKLLRVLQEKEIERIGGNKVLQLDVRIIAATNRNLEEMVDDGSFRQDLYYRLNVLKVEIPPLRELKNDIAKLCKKIIVDLNDELGMNSRGIEDEVVEIFKKYHWPGNTRELKNVLERAANVCKGATIQKKDLPIYLLDNNNEQIYSLDTGKQSSSFELSKVLEEAEKEAVQRALLQTGNNKKKAAELLGIHRSGLYQKIEKYGLINPKKK